jgi:hypothetical protein
MNDSGWGDRSATRPRIERIIIEGTPLALKPEIVFGLAPMPKKVALPRQAADIDELGYVLNLTLTFTNAGLGYCFAFANEQGFRCGPFAETDHDFLR